MSRASELNMVLKRKKLTTWGKEETERNVKMKESDDNEKRGKTMDTN